ncbi:hypothetical protein NLG97_g10238 [Lecanicillium saksenae]|uniref:Uncharacterized protein n=1 Tax=Lecanicillium saksenae TaxID=468837 RepID=A0ACC1QGH6_9HYPO|nr:hypothetical protein NLG97_g10238 [Lecanicillium saksenae]
MAKQNGASTNGKAKLANAAAEDSAEEGEITADEFEDLYESPEPEPIARQEKPPPEIDNSYVEMSDEERDRSGSYSPFLSPGEMDISTTAPLQLPGADADTAMALNTAQTINSSVDIMAETKSKAKDAIIRLQAANIRYQDYINEGIDKAVLDQLFGDLGLEKTSQQPAPPPSATFPVSASKTTTATTNAGATTSTADAAIDKSEERKDRIARLLAAKGSKASKSGGATVIGKVAKAPKVKVNSEKSKLLQQKMEALLKAREEKQKELERQAAIAAEALASNQESFSPGDGVAAKELSSALQMAVASDQATKPSTSDAVTSVSSPAKLLVTSNSGSGSASEGPFQKPFGQTRPFLIDVSDDDEDIDMEMVSPEQRLSSLRATTSPGRRQMAQYLLQSPGSSNIPPAGRHNLEHMNKEIEAMKKKIAAAEAKKRLKLSAPASPAASPRPRAYDIYEAKSSSPDIAGSMIHDGVSNRLPKVGETRLASPGSPKINRSRAASERLPMLESRRKEQLLRLKALQSQVANIERELKEGLEEEQKLREDLDYISDDDVGVSIAPEPAAPRVIPAHVHVESATSVDNTGQGLVNPVDMLSSDHIVTESSSRSSPEIVAEDQIAPTFDRQAVQPAAPETPYAAATEVAASSVHDVDVVMEEATSSGEEADDDSDGYEPAEASEFETTHSSPHLKMPDAIPELADSDPAVAALSAELLSAGRPDSAPVMEQGREAQENVPDEVQAAPEQPSYLAYDSPLRYFHSYRFHPDFKNVVAGGLRSATYSNTIDAKLPLCPDELAGNTCPRGKSCHFQHFAEMSAPARHGDAKELTSLALILDDQILLQLGTYTNCEDSRKQEFIEGLRELLTDYRNRKVKDFKTISQGIIEYRAKFHGDASKVLPLGAVSL